MPVLMLPSQEIRVAQMKVDPVMDQTAEFHDFAHIAYFTLNAEGCIQQVNLAGAILLNSTRSQVIGQRFQTWVTQDTVPDWEVFLKQAFARPVSETCKLSLLKPGGVRIQVEMQAKMERQDETLEPRCRVAIVDITHRIEPELAALPRPSTKRDQESTCLSQVADAVGRFKDITTLMRQVALIIANSYQPGEITYCRIQFDNQEAVTQPFAVTPWKQVSDMVLAGKRRGAIAVYFREEPRPSEASPSLSAQQTLLDSLAATVGEVIQQHINQAAFVRYQDCFGLLLKGLDEGIWDWDILSNSVHYSPRFCELLGFEPGEVAPVVDSWSACLHPEERNWVLERLRQHLEYHAPYDLECRLRTKGGDYRWFRDYGQALWDLAGKPLRMVHAIADITVRKEMMHQLEYSYSLLHATLESTAEGILVEDQAGEIISYNQTFAQMWGIPQELLNAKEHSWLRQLILDQLQAPLAYPARMDEIYAQAEAESYDNLELKDGRIFERYSQPQKLNGACVGRVWIFRDITARQKAEQELLQERRALEIRVQERTAALTQANVAMLAEIQERKRAELALQRANRALQTLSACDESLVRANSETDLLYQVCQLIVNTGGYLYAWIGLTRQNQPLIVEPLIQSGFSADYLDTLKITWANMGHDEGPAGPVGAALRSQQPFLCIDIPNNPEFASFQEEALRLGYHSAVALPLLTNQKCLGVLMIYSAVTDAFDPGELVWLKELANDLAYGLESHRFRAEHDRAMKTLEKWALIIQRAGWGVSISVADGGKLEMINDAFASMHGYTVAELTNQPMTAVCAPEFLPELRCHIQTARQKGRHVFEAVHVRKDGSRFPVLVDLSIIRDHSGADSYWVVYTQDLTVQKSLEARILEIGEQEQRRMGQDLHDGLCQKLTGVSYLLDTLLADLRDAGVPFIAAAERTRAVVREVLEEAHALAHGLHPVTIEDGGIVVALKDLIADFKRIYPISCRLICRSPLVITDTNAANHLYRIVREALANAFKHGQATLIWVFCKQVGNHLTITIKDNGKGIPSPLPQGRGLGLETMRFRARSIGAVLDIRRGDKAGTIVTCSLLKKS